MYRIIVDGEVVETVMYDDLYSIKDYIQNKYTSEGISARFEKIGD